MHKNAPALCIPTPQDYKMNPIKILKFTTTETREMYLRVSTNGGRQQIGEDWWDRSISG